MTAATPKRPIMVSNKTRPAHAITVPIGGSNSFENVSTVVDTLMSATGIAMADILFFTNSLNHLIKTLLGSAIL
jgi:hypothetical protein